MHNQFKIQNLNIKKGEIKNDIYMSFYKWEQSKRFNHS